MFGFYSSPSFAKIIFHLSLCKFDRRILSIDPQYVSVYFELLRIDKQKSIEPNPYPLIHGTPIDNSQFKKIDWLILKACQNVSGYYRQKVMESHSLYVSFTFFVWLFLKIFFVYGPIEYGYFCVCVCEWSYGFKELLFKSLYSYMASRFTIDKQCLNRSIWLIDRKLSALIDFNGMSTCLGLLLHSGNEIAFMENLNFTLLELLFLETFLDSDRGYRLFQSK